MTNEELAKSILMELEGGYISYGNFHGNHEQGLNLIKGAIEKQIAKPKHRYAGIRCVCGEVVARNQDYCEYCGQRLLPYEGD